jgi:hypothetical protein
MKYIIVLAAFLVVGITEMNAQEAVLNEEEVEQKTIMAHFTGEMLGGEDETFEMSMYNDLVSIKLSFGIIVFKISNKRIMQYEGVDITIYDISKVVSRADTDWEELRIFNLTGHTDEKKQAFASGVPTSRNYIIRISGTPVLGFLCDLDNGKL